MPNRYDMRIRHLRARDGKTTTICSRGNAYPAYVVDEANELFHRLETDEDLLIIEYLAYDREFPSDEPRWEAVDALGYTSTVWNSSAPSVDSIPAAPPETSFREKVRSGEIRLGKRSNRERRQRAKAKAAARRAANTENNSEPGPLSPRLPGPNRKPGLDRDIHFLLELAFPAARYGCYDQHTVSGGATKTQAGLYHFHRNGGDEWQTFEGATYEFPGKLPRIVVLTNPKDQESVILIIEDRDTGAQTVGQGLRMWDDRSGFQRTEWDFTRCVMGRYTFIGGTYERPVREAVPLPLMAA